MVASPYDSIVRIEGIPSVQGPTSISAVLLDNIAAVPYEGIWVPWLFTKQGSLELSGTISTLSCQLYGSNSLSPLNSYQITVGGTLTIGDVLSAVFTTPSGTVTAVYTTAAGNTTTNMAAGLAAFINTSMSFAALGFTASSAGAVLTVFWPSVAPPPVVPYTTSSTATAQVVTVATSVVGSATETMTVAAGVGGSALGSAITALGMTQFTYTARWLKIRLTTLTGGSVTAIAQGTA